MTTPTNPAGNPFGSVEGVIDAMQRSTWVGDPMLGGLPQAVYRSALPTADVGYRGRIVVIPGASGVADAAYLCLKTAADAYAWVRWDIVAAAIPDLALGGELGGTLSTATVDSVHAGSAHAIKRVASNTAEVTTVSTSAVDLLAFASLSIPVTSGIIIKGVARRTTGAAAAAGLGLKVNATVTCEAQVGTANAVWRSGAGNNTENGVFVIELGPRSGSYGGGFSVYSKSSTPATETGWVTGDAAVPNATITDIAIRAISGSGSVTVAVKEVAVFEVLYS